MSILIVEDNPVNAKLLRIILTAQGHETIVAKNGKEGLEAAAAAHDIQLIITDYMMPEMNGFEFIEKVRALPTFAFIPIIITSAYGDLAMVNRVKGLQCADFLAKPIDKEQLLKRVERLMASTPHLLLNKRKTMDQLHIDAKEFDDLINTFAAQLAAVLPVMVLEQENSEEPISEQLSQSLREIAESAAMMGAEKFVQLYERYMGSGRPARSQCSALLKVLQEMEKTLASSV